MTMWNHVTDEQREALVAEFIGHLPQSGIPDHLRDGLVRYFSDGILPGGFLQAVLCNDLAQASLDLLDPFWGESVRIAHGASPQVPIPVQDLYAAVPYGIHGTLA